MVKRFLLLLIYLMVAINGVAAQQTTQPSIVSFTASLVNISVDAAEAGQTEFQLSWHVVNLQPGQQLMLQQLILGAWQMLPTPETLFASGSYTFNIQHTLDFSPPTYRLLIVDMQGQVLDEQVTLIPYAVDTDRTPQIELFTTNTASVSAQELATGQARVAVSWQVSQRYPTANLIFEQVLPDGQVIPVELPRDNLWVASHGAGVVAPVLSTDGSAVQLRLRVVDLVSGAVYAEAITGVPVNGEAVALAPTIPPATSMPTITPLTEIAQATAPPPSPTPRNCVLSPLDVPVTGAPGDGCDTFRQPRTGAETRVITFSSSTYSAGPHNSVTLTWEISGAQFALLEMYDPQQIQEASFPQPIGFYDGLPAVGSQTIVLPGSMTHGARFIVWAANVSTEARSPAVLYDRLAYRVLDISPSGVIAASPAQITAFVALPQVAPAQGEVTLSWNLSGADAALIEMYDRNTNTLAGTVEDLPTIGSANIFIPAHFTQGARFVLWAANRNSDGSFERVVQSTLQLPAE